MLKLFWFASVAWMLVSAASGGTFAEISELSSETLYPKGAKLTVSPEGHFLVDGVPRYLPGTLFYEGVNWFSSKTDGYPESLLWLYEQPHGYETHQRMGFDATGMLTSNAWIEKYRPRKPGSVRKLGEDFLRVVIDSGLPLYVDFTAASWHHGQLKYVEGQPPCKEAFSQPAATRHHWMYYNPNHPEGMQLYEEMWRHGVKYALSLGAKPLIYELFNEPDFNDLSPTSRALFVEKLKTRYKTIEGLSAAWRTNYPSFEAVGQFKNEVENPALAVEWIKFMEWSFEEAVRRGVKVVREADPRPEVLICVQPLRSNLSNVNQYEVNRQLNAVCTCTGGGTAINAREYLSMAEGGKPVFDGETYLGHSAASMRSNLITQYARGLNASFVFKWDRRPWDPLWKQKDGGQKLAEKFSFLLLNPYCVKPEELRGIRQAKEEILLTSHLFTPRNRGIASQVAVLYSQPARRLARATGRSSYNLYYDYALAAERLALPYDIVFEGQLAERAVRYKVILVPGVACLTEEARRELEKYVQQGGTAVFIEEALQLDEYGNPLPSTVFPGIQPGEERVVETERVMLGELPLQAAIVMSPRFAEEEQWKVFGGGAEDSRRLETSTRSGRNVISGCEDARHGHCGISSVVRRTQGHRDDLQAMGRGERRTQPGHRAARGCARGGAGVHPSQQVPAQPMCSPDSRCALRGLVHSCREDVASSRCRRQHRASAEAGRGENPGGRPRAGSRQIRAKNHSDHRPVQSAGAGVPGDGGCCAQAGEHCLPLQ